MLNTKSSQQANSALDQLAVLINENFEYISMSGSLSLFSSNTEQYDESILEYLGLTAERLRAIAESTSSGEASISFGQHELHVRVLEALPENPNTKMLIITDVTAMKHQWQRDCYEKLETERSKLIQEFVRDVSHEFHTPIAGIKLSGYLLTKAKKQEDIKTRIKHINDRSDQIIHLVDDLKAMATVDYSPTVERDSVSLNSILETAYRLVIGQHGDNIASIRFSVDPHDITINTNKDEIIRAFVEIISNAVRYTATSGLITITTEYSRDSFGIIISDNGIGMSETVLSAAFSRFKRGDKSHTTSGFGLGLPMTKRIVERYGGEIEIQSELHQGTTVIVRFKQRG